MRDLRRIISLLQPHARALLLAVALAGLLSSCQGLLVILVRGVLDSVMDPSSARTSWQLAVAIVGLFVVQGSTRIGRTWLTRRAALRAERDLRNRIFNHLLRCDPAQLH